MANCNHPHRRINLSQTFTHNELVRAAIGKKCDRTAVDEHTKRKLSIAETTKTLADRIIVGSKGAVNPYREGRGLSFLDTLDGTTTPEQSYSNQNWLPQVASYNRRVLVRNLAIFLEMSGRPDTFEITNRDGEVLEIPGTYPGKRLQYRYMVLTGGPRVLLNSLDCRIIYIMPTYRCQTVYLIR